LNSLMKSFWSNRKERTYKFLMYVCILPSQKYLMQSNKNTFLFVWLLTHAPNVGKELPVNRSEQD
jgi:hypothetical protein